MGMDALARTARRTSSVVSGYFGPAAPRAACEHRNVCGSVGAGEQPIMSDAMEAFRHHVDQETPDELVGRQRHRLVPCGPLDP